MQENLEEICIYMSSRQTRKSRNNFVNEESPEEDKPLKPSNRTRRRSPLKEDK
jgi:hypothetical protein